MTCRWRECKWRFLTVSLGKVRGRLETISYLYRCTRCDSLRLEVHRAEGGRNANRGNG